jgi:hypothetical protein
VREVHKHIIELFLLVPAFGFLIPPVPSTDEPYPLLPGLAFAAVAYSGSLLFAIWRGAETWAVAATKLILFLAFGFILHARIAVS